MPLSISLLGSYENWICRSLNYIIKLRKWFSNFLDLFDSILNLDQFSFSIRTIQNTIPKITKNTILKIPSRSLVRLDNP